MRNQLGFITNQTKKNPQITRVSDAYIKLVQFSRQCLSSINLSSKALRFLVENQTCSILQFRNNKGNLKKNHDFRSFKNKFLLADFRERRGVRVERERELLDLLFHLFMHSLFGSCMCPDQELNPQP